MKSVLFFKGLWMVYEKKRSCLTEAPLICAKKVLITGLVHGVGFRPVISRIAKDLGVSGHVLSNEQGLNLHIEGKSGDLETFLSKIEQAQPAAACIDGIRVDEEAPQGMVGFEIIDEKGRDFTISGIPHDMAVCPDCLEELRNPSSRRYGYPFISCSVCGERFSVSTGIPFERSKTMWKVFEPCELCKIEAKDIDNRRYAHHLISCPECGPRYVLSDSAGFRIDVSNPVDEAARSLANGEILAIEGLSGFHILHNAMNLPLMDILRFRSELPRKPLVLMGRDMQSLESICQLTDEEKFHLSSDKAPILLVSKKRKSHNDMCDALSPYLGNLAVILPYLPIHHLLFEKSGLDYLVFTPANRSEEPILYQLTDAAAKLSGIVDKILHHNLRIRNRTDNSVGFVNRGSFVVTRRGRGYVPDRIELPLGGRCVIGAGAELRASFTLTVNNKAWSSPFIGNMDNREALDYYNSGLEEMIKWLRVEPALVVRDLHDAFFTSNYADSLGLPVLKLQHHFAHIYSVIAEQRLDPDNRYLSIVMDGSGLGDDGNLWGGEILEVEGIDMKRHGHIKYCPQPGNERAEKDIGRMAFAVVKRIYGEIPIELKPLFPDWDYEYFDALASVMDSDRTYHTSSIERFLDAAAFLVGICDVNTFATEALLRLESFRDNGVHDRYPYEISVDNIIDLLPSFTGLLDDVAQNVEKSVIVARIQNTVVAAFAESAAIAMKNTGVKEIILTGSSFQNKHFLNGISDMLKAEGANVYHNCRTPFNDQSISLGQALYGLLRLRG